jgi:hypothetical protein
MAHLPSFGRVVMLSTTAYLWHHNLMQRINFKVPFLNPNCVAQRATKKFLMWLNVLEAKMNRQVI